MKKLLVVPRPLQQESIFSYLLRLTNQNGYPTPYWVYRDVGLIKKETKLIIQNSPEIENLNKLTEIPNEVLLKLTYFDDLKITNENKTEFSLVYHYSIDGKYSKICPVCYKETPYQRKVWDYKTVIACPIHNCLLINKCSKCQKKIPHYRKLLQNCNCGQDLAELPVIKASKDEILFSSLVYQKVGFHNVITDKANKIIQNDLKLYQIIFLAMSLLNRIFYLQEKKFLKLDYFTEDIDFRRVLGTIYRIFSNWPFGFQNYLKLYQKINKPKNKSGISNDFDQLYNYLYRVIIDESYNFLRSEFENFIQEHWEGGSLHSNNKYMKIKDTILKSARDILKEYGVTSKILRRLIIDQKVRGKIIDKDKVKTSVLVNEIDLKSYLSYMEQFISKGKAVELLGININNINIMIKNGLIFADSYLLDILRKGNLRKSDINKILNTFKEKSKSNHDKSELVHCDNVLIAISAKCLDFSDFYNMVTLNLLTPYQIDTGKGIRDFWFESKQLNDAVQNYIINHSDFLTPKIIMDLYNIHKIDTFFFIREGFLQSEKIGNNHKIYKIAFQNFIDNYVTSNELIKLFNFSPSKIHSLLSNKGLIPLTVRSTNGKGAFLYRRKDLEKVIPNLQKM